MARSLVIGTVVALVIGGGTLAWWLTAPRSAGHAQADVPVATVAVVRTTLTTTTQLSGTLGFAGSFTVTDQLPGTVTALPPPGAVITRGHALYEVDGASVYLGYGSRPAWRAFARGMTPGPDVLELEQNLAALGFGTYLTIDQNFDWYTEQAIRDWQQATGQPITGRVELGRIAFAPQPLRIISDQAVPGAPAMPGQPVLAASSPDVVVTLAVPVTQTDLIHRGDRVTVTLPAGTSATGRVVDVSAVAAAASGGNQSSAPQPGGGQQQQQATVPATVALDHPAVAANLDQAPVTVNVIDRQVTGVLAVPVTSLVALAGGGYAVWVRSGDARRLVAVTPGLFADTLVAVSSVGAVELRVGDLVEVPSQ